LKMKDGIAMLAKAIINVATGIKMLIRP